MKRLIIPKRPDWQSKFEKLGFTFHSIGGTYWDEGVCYEFTPSQIDRLEIVTNDLIELCYGAVEHIIKKNLFNRLKIPKEFVDYIVESWEKDQPTIYGRFDLSYNGTDEPKLLEFNADTPTSLVESSVAQWVWLEDTNPSFDQFNSIHEKLESTFTRLKKENGVSSLHFSCVQDHEEDYVTTLYLMDVASQCGIETRFIYMEDIGYDKIARVFVDGEERVMTNLFKLYPWEAMLREDFGEYILFKSMRLFEPPWKLLLSNKGLLPILWELNPGHPNLLPSFWEEGRIMNYVKKPLWGREGCNIEMATKSGIVTSDGDYGSEGYIWQESAPLPCFDGNYAVIGSWVIGGEPAGIGIREDSSPITRNTSRFVPHYFKP